MKPNFTFINDMSENYNIKPEKLDFLYTVKNQILYDFDSYDMITQLSIVSKRDEKEKLIVQLNNAYIEAKENPWFFFSRMILLPEIGGGTVHFYYNEVNVIFFKMYFEKINGVIHSCRQTGKTRAIASLMYYEAFINKNYGLLYYAKDKKIIKNFYHNHLLKMIEINEPYMKYIDDYDKIKSDVLCIINHGADIKQEEVTKEGRGFRFPQNGKIMIDDFEFYLETKTIKSSYIISKIKEFMQYGVPDTIQLYGFGTLNKNLSPLYKFLIDKVFPQIEREDAHMLFYEDGLEFLKSISQNRMIRVKLSGKDIMDMRDKEESMIVVLNHDTDLMDQEYYLKR